MSVAVLRRIVNILLLLLLCLSIRANNLNLGGAVRIVDVSSTEATLEITLNWENSWRDNYNNDAAWVFFKYRTGTSEWESVLLPDVAKVDNSFTVMPGYSAGEVIGYFVYRSRAGSGDASTTFTFRWRYPSNLDRTMFESNQVFLMAQGIEMVYIPYGAYTLGDGSSNKSFTGSVGDGVEVIDNKSVDILVQGTGESRRLTPPYPCGYDGFYIMKYEVSQEQYVAFINNLSRKSQLELLPQLSSLKRGDYVFGSLTEPSNRNGIIVSVPMGDDKPAVLDNNFHNDNTYGGQDDGRTVACNYMSINDLLGYMSWSGLRPVSEPEYEKACRPLSPYSLVESEYAWGTTGLSCMTGIVSETSGWSDESPNDGWVNAEGRFGLYPGSGPVRCGAFASIASGRESAGSTYSGVMEMSGNVAELCLNTTPASLAFDGSLHGGGEFYIGEWGNIPSSGFGLRGGSFSSTKERLRVSDRTDMESGYFPSFAFRDSTVGFRGLRMLDRTKLGFSPGKILLNNSTAVTVCSGTPFTLDNAGDGGSSVLSGLLVTYRWYVNGKEIPREEGSSLSFPVGIYNTSVKDSVYRFTRRVFCALGELETEAVVLTVPGKLSLSLPSDIRQLRLACGVTSPVTASRISDTRFRWVNASDGKTIRDWSSLSKSDTYSPLHKDFGYMGAVRKLRCVSDVNGCRDSVELPLTIESSCYLEVAPELLSMTTNTNGTTGVATLCGPGSVSWYYKDNGGDEHLISTSTAAASSGSPLSYTVSYQPQYKDFMNTIGLRTVVVRSVLGDNSRCSDSREIQVNVKATLDPGRISGPSVACGDTEITINNEQIAGVEGMSGLTPVYSWYFNGSATPLANENGPTLKYRLPGNNLNTSVNYTFVRKAMTGSPVLQSESGASYTVSVPGIPTVTISAPGAVCDGQNLTLPTPAINWAGLTGTGTWTLGGNAVPSPVRYAHNGQNLVYTVSNSCRAASASNGVKITVNAKPTVGNISTPGAVCAGNALGLPAVPGVSWNGLSGSLVWQLNGGGVPNPVQVGHNGQTLTYVATNGCGTTVSNGVKITVNAITSITTQPVGPTICQGQTFTLTAVATGTNVAYQWQKNGSNIAGGNVYTKTNAVPADGGSYRCYITGTCGNLYTGTVNVTVYSPTVITSHPSGQKIRAGETISLGVGASGSNIGFQWQLNGGNIGGANGSGYTRVSAPASASGSYRCYVTGSCGSLYSNGATVTVVDWRNAGWSMTNDCTNCTYQEAINRCNAIGKRVPNNEDWWAVADVMGNVLSLSIGTGYWSLTKSADHPVGDDWATWSAAGGYGNAGNDNTSTNLTFSLRCVNK